MIGQILTQVFRSKPARVQSLLVSYCRLQKSGASRVAQRGDSLAGTDPIRQQLASLSEIPGKTLPLFERSVSGRHGNHLVSLLVVELKLVISGHIELKQNIVG